jgi:hypothetical protein
MNFKVDTNVSEEYFSALKFETVDVPANVWCLQSSPLMLQTRRPNTDIFTNMRNSNLTVVNLRDRISWLLQELSACQEGLCCIESVNLFAQTIRKYSASSSVWLEEDY